MKIETFEEQGVFCFKIDGRLDAVTAEAAEEQIMDQVRGGKSVIVSFSPHRIDVDYLPPVLEHEGAVANEADTEVTGFGLDDLRRGWALSSGKTGENRGKPRKTGIDLFNRTTGPKTRRRD